MSERGFGPNPVDVQVGKNVQSKRTELGLSQDHCGFRRSRPCIPIGSRQRFRSEAGHGSDLKPATQRSLPRIEAMMFRRGGVVKRVWIFWPGKGEKGGGRGWGGGG